MNNQVDDFSEFLALTHDVLGLVSPENVEQCQEMDMYPVLATATDPLNDQMEKMELLDLDLNKTSIGQEEQRYSGHEQYHSQNNGFYLGSAQPWDSSQYDTSNYCERDRLQSLTPFSEVTSFSSFPASPATVCSNFIPSAEFSPGRNNNNSNDCGNTKISRRRKVSGRCDKFLGKVQVQAKEIRRRRTKAEMEQMTPVERKNLKMQQNRENAKNCLAKKKAEKAHYENEVERQSQAYSSMKHQNIERKKQNLEKYTRMGHIDNNSPFGLADQFHEIFESLREEEFRKVCNYEVDKKIAELEEEYDDAQKDLEKKSKQNSERNAGSMGSAKCRANATVVLLKLKLESARLEKQIAHEKILEKVLADMDFKLNPHAYRRPESVFGAIQKIYEPS